MMLEYDGKSFGNICAGDLDLSSEEERLAMAQTNAESIVLLTKLKNFIGTTTLLN